LFQYFLNLLPKKKKKKKYLKWQLFLFPPSFKNFNTLIL
jgi:hypothetical protein